jgi:hypothetical protein
MEKVVATRYEALRLVEMPMKLTIHITSRVAAQSEDAMEDLCNLRTTCKAMCIVCSATTVRRRLPLKRVLRRQFNLGLDFRAALITTMANAGNPEVLFRSGLCLTLLGNKHGIIVSWLNQLRRAVEASHKVSMYTITLFLYRPNNSEAATDEAWWLLRLVEGPEEGRRRFLRKT